MFKCANKTKQLKKIASDQPNNNEDTLFSAVKLNDLEKISYFIDQGVDVNAHDRFGLAPLHYVTSKEALDLLVEKQADVHIKSLNISNISGFVPDTPLSSACFYGKYPLVDPILQYYSLSDLEEKPQYIKNDKILSLIWNSIDQGKKDLQALSSLRPRQLEQQTQVSEASELVTNEIETEDLFSAIYANDLEKFKQLISQVANIHVYKVKKDTLLSFAMSRYGYPFLTPIFLHSSSDLNEEPPDYIEKNKLAVSLRQACRQSKLPFQLITSSAIPTLISQFYRKKNQFFADLWEKYKQNPRPLTEDLTKVDRLIQDLRF
jgi:ankyrin repeat protein